jgi:hypothetical protein
MLLLPLGSSTGIEIRAAEPYGNEMNCCIMIGETAGFRGAALGFWATKQKLSSGRLQPTCSIIARRKSKALAHRRGGSVVYDWPGT